MFKIISIAVGLIAVFLFAARLLAVLFKVLIVAGGIALVGFIILIAFKRLDLIAKIFKLG